MPALCPLCVSDEYTSEDRTPDGIRFATCENAEHGAEPFVWEVTERRPRGTADRGGLGAELDIWTKLLECVVPGEASVPYGTVEDRFFDRYPEDAITLLRTYGHRWRDPNHISGRFSMSTYLATRLSELADEGHLVKTFGPSEGRWSHNGVISWWRTSGTEAGLVEPRQAEPEQQDPPPSDLDDDIQRLAAAAASLPVSEGDYTETDFVTNLMATVLDYQMQSSVVERSIAHYKEHRWGEIRTLEDLEERFAWHPDTQAGNTALAQALRGTKHWTRAHQLRDLAAFFRSIGVTDQSGLSAWAETATFERDFRGMVKGLGPAVFQWLVMRQGVDTVKPDVHVRRFVEHTLGRSASGTEVIELVTATADKLEIAARELDWRIWEAARRGDLTPEL